MKVELTTAEKKQIDDAMSRNRVRKWLTIRDTLKFEIGDVLIKHHIIWRRETSDYGWTIENINSDTKMAQRYVYIFEDDQGIGYFKQLKISTGTLGKELFCVTDIDFDSTRFEVDPEYAEHTLLDVDFDIKKIHKKSLEGRNIVTKMNRKMGARLKTFSEFNKFFDNLKQGDTYWTTRDFTGRYVYKYNIQSLTKISVAALNANMSWSYKQFREANLAAIDAADCYQVICEATKWGTTSIENFNVFEHNDKIFYTQEPAQEEK